MGSNDGDRDGWDVYVYDFDRNLILEEYYQGNNLSRIEWTGYFPAGAAYVRVDPHWRLVNGSSYHLQFKGALIDDAVISGLKNTTYTGSAITPKPVVRVGGVTLLNGTDYSLSYKNNVNVGTATVTVVGKGAYTGSISKTFTIAKANNTLKVSAKSKVLTVKYSKLKKKNQTISKAKAFKVSANKESVTFQKASGSKKITVSKAGKITVKKGLKKKTYTVKVRVAAKGNKNYKPATKTVTLKVRVK